ncbi:hypothetical protein C0J52_10329 [Blattella germanica]|nr:hypothetical protein C0J52_10329 [Blattella germanica]
MVIIVLLLSAAIISKGHSLQCYMCRSIDTPACKENLQNIMRITCVRRFDRCMSIIRPTGVDSSEIDRLCANKNMKKDCPLKDICYTCAEDLCNSHMDTKAPTDQPVLSLLALLLFAHLFIHRILK